MARPRSVSNEDFLDAIGEDPRAFLSTPEVADLVGVSLDTARRRLNEMYDEGEDEAEPDIDCRKLDQMTIWWLPSTVVDSDREDDDENDN